VTFYNLYKSIHFELIRGTEALALLNNLQYDEIFSIFNKH
jgi:hypothetical protein